MRVLVTGGAGFIGSHVCDRLIAEGHNTVAVDNLVLGRRHHLAHLEELKEFQFIELDASNIADLYALFKAKQFECVFHLAANSDIARSHDDPNVDFINTLTSTYAVLEAMRRTDTRQLILASTSAVYGEVPGRVSENYGPLLPISHYGAAKLSSEAFLSSFGENYGVRSWIARFPNIVGERLTHGAIYDFVRRLRDHPEVLRVLGDGTQVKPYLHVGDLIDALMIAWRGMHGRLNIFNVGGPTRCTVRRLAEIVVEESGHSSRIEFTNGDRGWIGDVPKVDYDTSLIRSLGWTPRLDSEGAVRRAARWMFDNH
jgi:UDP-glucose 4-epimerase